MRAGVLRMLRRVLAPCALVVACNAIAAAAPSLTQLSLRDALQIAAEGNLELKLAASAERAAMAAQLTAGEAPNPTLTLQSFNINPHAGIGGGTLRQKTVDSAVRIDQVIERGNKRGLRSQTAGRLALAAQADLAEARRQSRIAVANAFYDLLAAQQKAAISSDIAALYAHGAGAAHTRQKAGDLSGADLVRVEVDAQRAQNDASQAALDLSKARQAFGILLGIDDAAGHISAAEVWPVLETAAVEGPDAALERRPDVAAARLRVSAAESALQLALAARTRDVTVGVQFEHFPASAANPQGSGNSIGVALQIPLLLRNRFDGEIAQAHAALEAAELGLQRARQLARAELSGSREAVRSAMERLHRYERELLPGAKKAADAAEFAFSHGALSVSDMLDIRRTYRAAQIDAVAARLDAAKALTAVQASISESDVP